MSSRSTLDMYIKDQFFFDLGFMTNYHKKAP